MVGRSMDQDNVQQAGHRGCARLLPACYTVAVEDNAALLLADDGSICIDPRSGRGHEACPHRRRQAFWQ
jgi:hypothetical protein